MNIITNSQNFIARSIEKKKIHQFWPYKSRVITVIIDVLGGASVIEPSIGQGYLTGGIVRCIAKDLLSCLLIIKLLRNVCTSTTKGLLLCYSEYQIVINRLNEHFKGYIIIL
jgi:hypothetical protein